MPSFNPDRDMGDLTGKVVFITGATAGIGKAALFAFAAHNASKIYFTGRNADAGAHVVEEARRRFNSVEVVFVRCDLSLPREEIRRVLAENFKSDRLDIFIGNAAIMATPPAHTAEGFEQQWGVNYVGHAVMLKLLLPTMLRTVEAGEDVRLVLVSSWGHTMHPNGGIDFAKLYTADYGSAYQRYGASKMAANLLALGMSKRYPQIISTAVAPGLVRTELAGRAENNFMSPFIKLAYHTPLFATPEKGAHNILWASTAVREQIKNGAYYDPGQKLPGKVTSRGTGIDPLSKDETLEVKLWEWTQNELKDVQPL